jgi:hypothetical protein
VAYDERYSGDGHGGSQREEYLVNDVSHSKCGRRGVAAGIDVKIFQEIFYINSRFNHKVANGQDRQRHRQVECHSH